MTEIGGKSFIYAKKNSTLDHYCKYLEILAKKLYALTENSDYDEDIILRYTRVPRCKCGICKEYQFISSKSHEILEHFESLEDWMGQEKNT
jgi:hypothetical protein